MTRRIFPFFLTISLLLSGCAGRDARDGASSFRIERVSDDPVEITSVVAREHPLGFFVTGKLVRPRDPSAPETDQVEVELVGANGAVIQKQPTLVIWRKTKARFGVAFLQPPPAGGFVRVRHSNNADTSAVQAVPRPSPAAEGRVQTSAKPR